MARMYYSSKKFPIVVLFDYGGVLADHHIHQAEEELAGKFSCSISDIQELLSEKSQHGRMFREDRISEDAFWDAVMTSTGRKSRPSSDSLTELWAKTYRNNLDMFGLLERLKEMVFTGIITNIDRGRSRYLKEIGVISRVDFYFPSFQFGSTKPKIAIYLAIEKQLRDYFKGPYCSIYIDDKPSHIIGLESIFEKTLLHKKPDVTIDAVDQFVREEVHVIQNQARK